MIRIKQIIALLCSAVLMIALSACGTAEDSSAQTATETSKTEMVTEAEQSRNETREEEETEEPIVIDTSWYIEDNTAIAEGVYFVGKDIAAGNYIFACDDESTAEIIIFDTEESYWNYYRSSRFTHGEESDAVEANAFIDEYARGEHTLAVNLQDGYVMKLRYAHGTLTRADGSDTSTATDTGRTITVAPGIYNSGDIAKGGYMLTCTDQDSAIKVLVFENKDAFDAYYGSKRATMGEEGAAIEANAMFNFYVDQGETVYINVRDDMVLAFDYGSAQMEEVHMSWAE